MFYNGQIMGGAGTLGFGPDLFDTGGWFGDPRYSGSSIDWNNVINQGFGIGSQAIAAWGRNPTQQIGNSSVIGIGQGYSPAATLSAQAQAQAAFLAQQRALGGGGGAGGVGLDDAATSITGFISRNPLLVAGGVLGLFLLFRQPPGRR